MKKKYNSLEIEKKYQDLWSKNKVYAYDSHQTRDNNFIIDTPPPTVSGSLHIGHVFSYTQTDVIARHQRMMGKNVFYPMGWDDNGLPTERRIQNLFGVRCDPTKDYDVNFKPTQYENPKKIKSFENISRKNFLEVCKTQVLEDEKKYQNLWSHLGLSVDWNENYKTIGPHAQKISQKSFLNLYKKALVENRFAPVLWDVSFQTAVAQADIEDRPKQGFYHDIKFQVKDGKDFVISTTRPELLAACVAVAAHPSDKRYKDLFGKKAVTPLFEAEVPIIPSDHADPEKGTGILMICTFGDMDDVRFWKKQSLDLKQIIGKQGRIQEVCFESGVFKSLNPQKAKKYFDQIQGLKVHQARTKMKDLLKEAGILVGEPKPKEQFVKYYEKGDQPLELITTRQWFIKVLDFKEDLIEYGKKVEWHPESFFKRYEQWVSNLDQDWCISRQRFFGVPFPVWYPLDNNGEPDYTNILIPEKLPTDPMKEAPPNYKESQRGKKNGFIAESDVMDTWASSSLSPFINSYWEEDSQRHKKLFPADLRPQAHEIIRTWAFYTIVQSYFHEKSIPWKHIAISGWVVDPNKSKMSKSKGNVITPEKLIESYSADAVRYWASKARLGQDTIYEEQVFKVGQRLVTKIFNASNFVKMQLENCEFKKDQWEDYKDKITEATDQSWILKLEDGLQKSSDFLQKFEYAPALDLIEKLFWSFCDNYLELVKARAYQLKDKPQGISALYTLDYSLYCFLKLFAPYLPYITEEVWSWRYLEESSSIHKSHWPKTTYSKSFAKQNIETIDLCFLILEKIRGIKSSEQKSLNSEVKRMSIELSSSQKKMLDLCQDDILRAGHIKTIDCSIAKSSDQEPLISLEI